MRINPKLDPKGSNDVYISLSELVSYTKWFLFVLAISISFICYNFYYYCMNIFFLMKQFLKSRKMM